MFHIGSGSFLIMSRTALAEFCNSVRSVLMSIHLFVAILHSELRCPRAPNIKHGARVEVPAPLEWRVEAPELEPLMPFFHLHLSYFPDYERSYNCFSPNAFMYFPRALCLPSMSRDPLGTTNQCARVHDRVSYNG